ncbi:MAG: hypothetical protein IMZ64_05110 [Bacteroidetes bacterium]|nr:hypothetical protein [Bacteroidota bacterium]
MELLEQRDFETVIGQEFGVFLETIFRKYAEKKNDKYIISDDLLANILFTLQKSMGLVLSYHGIFNLGNVEWGDMYG